MPVDNSFVLGLFGQDPSAATAGRSALAAFRTARKDEAKRMAAFADSPAVKRQIDDFRRRAAKIESVDELVKDRRVFSFVLSAFNLDAEIHYPGKLKRVLESDLDDVDSFANRLRDPRFQELAKFFEAAKMGLLRLKGSGSQNDLVQRFLVNEYDKKLGAENPALREANYFLRNVGKADGAFGLLGDLVLREVTTTTLGLPPEIARQSIDTQAALITRRVDIERFKLSVSSDVNLQLDRLKQDQSALTTAIAIADKADSAAKSLATQLEGIQLQYEAIASLTSGTGSFAAEIPIQEAAAPTLVRQHALVSAAQDALSETSTVLSRFNELINEALADPSELATFQAEFAALATDILGDGGSDTIGVIDGATYYNAATGQYENLLKSGGGATADSSITLDTLPATISVQVRDDGTTASVASEDASQFLTDFQAVATAFANGDLTAASSALTTAKASFTSLNNDIAISAGTFNASVALIANYVGTYETPETTKGLLSLDDAADRVTQIRDLLYEIRTVAQQGADADADHAALDAEFATLRTQIETLVDNAEDGSLDNLLLAGDQLYTLIGTDELRASGQDLDTLLNTPLAGQSITDTTTAQALSDLIGQTLTPLLERVEDDIARERVAFAFAVETLDPIGRVDGQLRELEENFAGIVNGAGAGGRNLLAPFTEDYTVTLQYDFSQLTLKGFPTFQADTEADFESARGDFIATTDLTTRIDEVTEALYRARSVQSSVAAARLGLDISLSSVNSQLDLLQQDEKVALEPIKATDYAIKFVEKFLARRDLQAQGFGAVPVSAAVSAGQAVLSLVRPINRGGFSILA